jgi:hypothetical protein
MGESHVKRPTHSIDAKIILLAALARFCCVWLINRDGLLHGDSTKVFESILSQREAQTLMMVRMYFPCCED